MTDFNPISLFFTDLLEKLISDSAWGRSGGGIQHRELY